MNAPSKSPKNSVVAAVSVKLEIVSMLITTVRALTDPSKNIQEGIFSDSFLQKVIHYYRTKSPAEYPDKMLQNFFHH